MHKFEQIYHSDCFIELCLSCGADPLIMVWTSHKQVIGENVKCLQPLD